MKYVLNNSLNRCILKAMASGMVVNPSAIKILTVGVASLKADSPVETENPIVKTKSTKTRKAKGE
ncbi:hypothetical protein BAGR45_05855 [Bacillus velezensis]|nr:hypothetical protein BAGR45_05855 [Bacillus velezensis]